MCVFFIIKKISSRVKFLYRKSKFLNRRTKQMLVSALIQCHLDYAASYLFSSLTKTTETKLIRCQNKAIRFILNVKPRTSLKSVDDRLAGFLPLSYRVNSLKLCQLYKVYKGIAPSYLISNFKLIDHHYDTRLKLHKNFFVNSHNKPGQQTFQFTASNLWRTVPTPLKLIEKYETFKRELKKFMWDEVFRNEKSDYQYY